MYSDYEGKKCDVMNARVFHGKAEKPYIPVTMEMAPAFPTMTTVRLWVGDEVIDTTRAPISVDLEYVIEKFKPSWHILEEKDCTDYPSNHEYGFRDVYCFNKTMLQLFSK